MSAYAKAIVGALATGVGSVAVAAVDGLITAAEWWSAAAVTLVALYAVWRVPNTPSDGPGHG